MDYHLKLAKRLRTIPPRFSDEDRYGIFYGQTDPESITFLKNFPNIESVDDEIRFYIEVSKYGCRNNLLAIISGNFYAILNEKEFSDAVVALSKRTPEEKIYDDLEYFSYYGLEQDVLLDLLKEKIEEENKRQIEKKLIDTEEMMTAVRFTNYDDDEEDESEFEMPWMPDFDGVQIDSRGRARTGPNSIEGDSDDDDFESYQMRAIPDDDIEMKVVPESSEVSGERSGVTGEIHPLEVARPSLQEFSTSRRYEKLCSGYKIKSTVYEYVQQYLPGILRFQKCVKEHNERVMIGYLLSQDLEPTAPVPMELSEHDPGLEGKTVCEALLSFNVRVKKYLTLRAAQQRKNKKPGGKVFISSTDLGPVLYRPTCSNVQDSGGGEDPTLSQGDDDL